MPDQLKDIVQRMIDAGESEENIAAVIKEHSKPANNSGVNKPIKSASSWGQGVIDSFTSGEAPMAGLKGLAGFAKGALYDIPSTLWDSSQTISKMPNPLTAGITRIGGGFTDPNEVNDVYEGLKATPGQMVDTTMRAGSKPFEFGEMTGQITGQPIATEMIGGMIPKIPVKGMVRAAGRGAKTIGEFSKTNTPISKMIPRAASIPAMESVERAAGSGLSRLADSMQNVGSPKIMRNVDYGPTPYKPQSRISPTGDLKGSMSFPDLTETPELVPNSKFEPVGDFSPEKKLISPTGPQKGSVTYPETNEVDPSVIFNDAYGPTDLPDSPNFSPTGDMHGSMSFPEISERPSNLILNSEYGPPDTFLGNGITHLSDELYNMNSIQPQMSDWGTSPGDMWPPSRMPANEAGLTSVANGLSDLAGNPSIGGTSLLEAPRPLGGPPEMAPTSTNGSISALADSIGNSELPPAREWKPPVNTPEDSIGDFDLSKPIDLNASVGDEIINPRGPEYTKRVLNYAKKGEPGFNIEPSGKDFHLVYRGPDGNPVGVAKIVKDSKGNMSVSDVAVDKGKGLLSGRAAKAIGDKLKEMKIDTSQSGYTPEGMKFKKRLSKAS